MRKLIYLAMFLLIGISCFAQEVEVCGSLNTSSEQRFQNALGIGLQYQHDISKRFRVGFGAHYNFNKAQFIDRPYVDAAPWTVILDKTNSDTKRFSIRLNIQGLLKDNEYVSLSLGPEISYNYLWGKDNIDRYSDSNWSKWTRNNDLAKEIGIGFISQMEIKDFMTKQLSLCFTIRPELLIGKNNNLDGISAPVFSGPLSLTEFQMGLKYRFKNPA
jgi:hypothetical protein